MVRRMTRLQRKVAIAHISRIRTKNNVLWMQLLALAVEAKPRKAKAILEKIRKNDKEVTEWFDRI